MIHKFTLPAFGEIADQAIIHKWHKNIGDPVARGEVIIEITVDKATLEIESDCDGYLTYCTAKEGDLVPAGGIVAIISGKDEGVPPNMQDVKYPRATADACMRFRKRLDNPVQNNTTVPLNAMRTVISRRMTQSKEAAPHFYVQTAIDMSACVALRQFLKQEKKERVSYNDMIIRACGLALAKFPQVAALYTPKGYVMRNEMNVGFAVAVEPDGLLVPVIRNADTATLTEISTQARDLAKRARKHQLLPDDYAGSVFTVSNLGSFDVDNFTAIINPGESAILAIGKIVDTPVVKDGEITVCPIMKICLSSDHRVIDGVLAAKFNSTIKSLLENPSEL